MIVPKQVAQGILEGRVTTMRVPLDTFRLQTWTDQDGNEQTGKPSGTLTLKAAKDRPEDWPVNRPSPASKTRLCSVRILDAQRVNLDATTLEDARADGYADPGEYALAYMAAYARSWTDTEAWLLTFEVNRRQGHSPMGGAWDPGSDGTVGPERKPAPEPEKVASGWITRRNGLRYELDQQQREALYRSLSLEDRLRMIRQDDHLRVAGRNDLRVIEKRLEAIWSKGNKAA